MKIIEDTTENPIEDAIWDTITNSAKNRFDYKSFEAGFRLEDGKIPENILFQVIVRLASGETKESVAAHLKTEALLLGCSFEDHVLESLLEHKEKELKTEIHAAQLAHTMLENGAHPDAVLETVHKLFDTQVPIKSNPIKIQ
jgi:hypothetical protein